MNLNKTMLVGRYLDYYWNRYWADVANIKLIVCGSAASWMLDHVISHKGGLHNRISGQIALHLFDLKETKAFLLSKAIQYNDAQILEIFMVTGGVPYYLNFVTAQAGVYFPRLVRGIQRSCCRARSLDSADKPRKVGSLELYEQLPFFVTAHTSSRA